jgi:hypothetical protein
MIGEGAGYYPNIGGGVGMAPTFNAAPSQQQSERDYFKPAIPFTCPTRGFHPGEKIRVVFVPQMECKRFKIDLKQGLTDNILFHLNVRFDEKKAVMNSTSNGKWLEEYRPHGFPFELGHVITVDLVAEPNGIRVMVDESHLATFGARDDLGRTDTLTVDGAIKIHSVTTSF